MTSSRGWRNCFGAAKVVDSWIFRRAASEKSRPLRKLLDFPCLLRFDRHNALGGMLMASEELPLGRWDEALPEPALPRVSWRGQKALALLAAATAYLLVGFLLPQRFIAQASNPPLDIRREVIRLSG